MTKTRNISKFPACPTSPTSVLSLDLISAALLSASETLFDKANDASLPVADRWQFVIAMREAEDTVTLADDAKSELIVVEKVDIDETNPINIRLDGHFAKFHSHQNDYQSAFTAACAASEITDPSPASANHPDAVWFITRNHAELRDWQLAAWDFEIGEPSHLRMMRIDFQNRRFVKLIEEPYPEGYPAETVEAQMMDFDETIVNYTTSHPFWQDQRNIANGMRLAAASNLHTHSAEDIYNFMQALKKTSMDSSVTQYIYRAIAGHQPELIKHFEQGHHAQPYLIDPAVMAKIIETAASAGTHPTQLWELTTLVGFNPMIFGLNPPMANYQQTDELDDVAQEHGLPASLISRISLELSDAMDEHKRTTG